MPTLNALLRLRKHADYGRVYGATRKQFAREMSFFFALRPALGPDGRPNRAATDGPRVGLTVGKVLGRAVERNRIKRRLRALVQRHAPAVRFPVDVILHPRRTVLTMEHAQLDREVSEVFRKIQTMLERGQQPGPPGPDARGPRRGKPGKVAPPAATQQRAAQPSVTQTRQQAEPRQQAKPTAAKPVTPGAAH